MGRATQKESAGDVWITPRPIIQELGPFDLDPCAAVERPWDCAKRNLTIHDDGLQVRWRGFVWMNPPYSDVATWMDRMAKHRNGIALVFARTETRWFHDSVWGKADCLLFRRGRINFLEPDGGHCLRGRSAKMASVFVGYGKTARERLSRCSIEGHLVNG